MKTKIFKQGIQTIIPFTILLFIIVFGFVSCDIIDPEKNCNETKKYKKTNHPSELILSYNEVDAYYTIKDICPENLLAITAKVN
ncbi:MAG TPA: hypothetical protein ENK75_07540, partial [Saprospiraceae bacterium]|nr:hypothetical protein [Saprospiraceae bacterium]